MAPYYAMGKYWVTGVDQAWTESSNGNDMLVLKVRVDAEAVQRIGEDGEVHHDRAMVENQYTRTIRVVLMPSNIEMAMKKLRYAGFTGRSFDELDLVGSQFLAVSREPQQKDGKEYEQWDLALPPLADGGPPLESKPGVTKRLNALFGKQLKEGPEPAASKPAPAPAPVPAGGGGRGPMDDDIPFSAAT